MQRQPNLFIVGAPKCGTTAWVSYLSTHPQIFFSPAKEPHFFCTDFPAFRWARSLEEYEALFVDAGAAKIVAEASVQYLYSEKAAENISRYNPQAKIMIFLRDQGDFLPSYHNQLVYNGDETIEDFAAVWEASPDGRNRQIPVTCREPKFLDYAAAGRFSEQIERYTDLFPSEQIKIIEYDRWVGDPRATYLEIMDFLELQDDGRTEFERVHGAKHHKHAAIARLTQRPPALVLIGARWMKKVLGRERLGMADALRSLNAKTGYANAIPKTLKAEIDAAFAEERARVQTIVTELRHHAKRSSGLSHEDR